MNKPTHILLLDLDGVLITTPPWKPDQIDTDDYSMFNSSCVKFLNQLLCEYSFEIWLSSTRRTMKSLDEFNRIFKHRNIKQQITGFVPEYVTCKNRREEITTFLETIGDRSYLIIDDDKSLNTLAEHQKKRFVLTKLTTGFSEEKYQEALIILSNL